jgi:hypothetical protein
MSDSDVYRQSRKKVSVEEVGGENPPQGNAPPSPAPPAPETTPAPPSPDRNFDPDPLAGVKQVRSQMAEQTGGSMPETFAGDSSDAPFQISGNMPSAFREALANRAAAEQNDPPPTAPPGQPPQFPPTAQGGMDDEFEERPRKRRRRRPTPDRSVNQQSSALKAALDKTAGLHLWENFDFPSVGKFYNGTIPPSIQVRAMTGEEEQILATPRFVRRGRAIDMIFRRCIKENIQTERLLSIDRTHLLIYLRGISYTPEYDVEIRCPECQTKFSTVIDLNSLEVTSCPDDFGEESLEGYLPNSGFFFRYRMSTGADETAVNNYRDKRIQMFGDQSEDDTFLYRTAILLDEIENVEEPKEINVLLKRLPIADVSFLRNEINNPPFGVDTEVPMQCPSCAEEFTVDLPLEASFFFPRKKEKTHQ